MTVCFILWGTSGTATKNLRRGQLAIKGRLEPDMSLLVDFKLTQKKHGKTGAALKSERNSILSAGHQYWHSHVRVILTKESYTTQAYIANKTGRPIVQTRAYSFETPCNCIDGEGRRASLGMRLYWPQTHMASL